MNDARLPRALIIIFMKRVVEFSDDSKMDERNVSLMFGPNLFRMHSQEPLLEYAQTEIKVDLCIFLMTFTVEIFGKEIVTCLTRRLSKAQKL